jgi:hypothetical protein
VLKILSVERGKIMTNDSVKGYIIFAMKDLGYSLEDVDEILEKLEYYFDIFAEGDAEDYYRSLKWQDNNRKTIKDDKRIQV